MLMNGRKILFFAYTEWYLYNFRSALLGAVDGAGYGVKCVSPPGPYGQRLRQAGFDWQALPFARDSRLGMLRSAWRTRASLRALIREDRPAVVHSFTLTSILLAGLAGLAGVSVRARWAACECGDRPGLRIYRHFAAASGAARCAAPVHPAGTGRG